MKCRLRRVSAAIMLGTALALPLEGAKARSHRSELTESQLQKAVSFYNSGRYQEAAQLLESIEQQLPASFEVEELLGLVYSAESKDDEASPHLERAVQLKPSSAAARTNLAVSLARLGKSTLAEAEFKKAIQAEPNNFSANHNFGEFYARAGKPEAAIPYFQTAQRAQPSSYGNGYDLALALLESGKLVDARRQIQALLELRDRSELHALLADVEEKSGNYVAAANEYQQAAQMEPSESNIFHWGSELLLHQTLNPAIEVFSKGVQRYPNSPRLRVGLGLALYWSGRYEDAVKALIRATDLSPSDSRPYYFLSKAYAHSQGQADEVIKRFQRFSRLRPQDSRATYYYAMSLWKGKQNVASGPSLDHVVMLLSRAIQLDPAFAQAHLELGDLYSQQHKYAEAVPEYRRAIELDSKLVDAYYRLGQAYARLGNAEMAKEEFQIHKRLYQQHLAKWDAQQEEIRQFTFSRQAEASRPQ
ncbi:MAG TPA: tetratricopeptide repeat protein [Terriglobia bacterium]|nr:tetratricopeptide repeat protein [Terriglobia bacterium]